MEVLNFWKSISILLKNYHAINKKVFACKTYQVHKILKGVALIDSENSGIKPDFDFELIDKFPELEIYESCEDDVICSLTSSDYDDCEGYILKLKFVAKNDDDNVEAVAIIDFVNIHYTCTFKSTTFDDFRIALESEDLIVNMLTNRRRDADSNRWAEFVLKPKLCKWSKSLVGKESALVSLDLIDVEMYNSLYNKLKTRYSKELFEIWSESTDPFKFVYEDMAIAAYLICLWKEHHCTPKAFADLGCGNGLLVYILNQEGIKGCGYDVRSRKIWSLYPKTTLLFEETITPNKFKLPPEVDWLIGNHSDELSAWIPVIAAINSFRMKYFLLPCCSFEFSGTKFQRRNSKLSSYKDFLAYVEMVSQKCGFLTLRDRLKIPSTKRIAVIGISRSYVELSHKHMCSATQEFIATELKNSSMKLRERNEAVRNCTQISTDIIDDLVKKIFLHLLGPVKEESVSEWNEGVKRTIKELVQNLSKEDLKNIKSECGGLKTLLKNKHEIFEFCPGNIIQIRRPKLKNSYNVKAHTTKKRCCFFAVNHPMGCPLTESECTFIHP